MLIEIPGFKNYFIRETGEIYSAYSNRLIKPFINTSGYECYKLYRRGSQHNLLTHRLLAFVYKNLPSLDSELEVDHNDNCKTNNSLINLVVRNTEEHLTKTLAARGLTKLNEKKCASCGAAISKSALKCVPCNNNTTNLNVTLEAIEYWVTNYSWVRASKELGLSDNGLRKRYKKLSGKDPKELTKR